MVSEVAAASDFGATHPYHIVLHPNWGEEPYLYVSATYFEDDGDFRLGVFRIRYGEADGRDTAQVIYGLPPGSSPERAQTPEGIHIGSALAFCGDALYLSVGDGDLALPLLAAVRIQDPREPYGKILRYRLHGTELEPDGVLTDDPPVYAMGFRNPFGMDCAKDRGIPVVADNGPQGHDQVRFVEPGSNHEWPISTERDQLSSPFFTSGATKLGVAGVAWVDAATVLLAAFNPQSIYSLTAGESGELVSATVFFEVDGPPVAVARGADNCTYVADFSRIWRIMPVARPEVPAPSSQTPKRGPSMVVMPRDRSSGRLRRSLVSSVAERIA